MSKNDDWLDSVLQEDEPYVHNEAFSRRVLDALPSRRRSRVSRRKKIVFVAGVLGFALSLPLAFGFRPVLESGLIDGAWFLTVSLMVSLGMVGVIAWWMLAVRE